CARVCADCHTGGDRGRRNPHRLSHAADSDLQHNLDPAGRLCDVVSSLRDALCVERNRPNSSRARGDGCGRGRRPPPDVHAHLASVLLAGWIYVFVLAVRELGASIFLVGPGTHVLGTISLTMWEEGGSYGAVAALGVIQIVPLIVIVAGLRSIELRIQRRAQVQSS